jgi:hypothetical protein
VTTVNEAAERYLVQALEEYDPDNEMPARLIVETDREIELMCILTRTQHPGDIANELLARIASLLDVTLAVLVTEAWARSFPKGTHPDGLARGELERMKAAGDDQVRTDIVVVATDGLEHITRTADAETKIDEVARLRKEYPTARTDSNLAKNLVQAIRRGRAVRRDANPSVYLSLRALSGPEVALTLGASLAATGLITDIILGTAYQPHSPDNN